MQDNPILTAIRTRTSPFTKYLGGPGPDRSSVLDLLSYGMSAPDHGAMTPWRFCILQGNELLQFADRAEYYFIAEQKNKTGQEPNATDRQNFRTKILRAPTVVAVWATPNDKKPIPRQEQVMTVAMAVGQILLASGQPDEHGRRNRRAVFLTGFIAYCRPLLAELFGISDRDEFLGYIYIGQENLPADQGGLPQKKRAAIDPFIVPFRHP